jgi:hypothetical protein
VSVTETMRRIEFLLEKHAPKYSTPCNVGAVINSCVKDRPRRLMTKSQKAEARRLRVAGYSYRDISAAVDASESCVYRALTGSKH